MKSKPENIVITGAGLVTGLGLSREQTWQSILENRTAIGPLTAMESPLPDGADGGQAPELPSEFLPDLPREIRYLKWTIAEALLHANLSESLPYPAHRCGMLLGTTLHGMRAAGRFFRTNDYAQLKHFPAGAAIAASVDSPGFTGRTATICSACSSSLGSIALAITLLQSGEADLILAGGYDTISEYVYGGFNSLKLVTPGPLRPFARGRQGMKLAEGYGIVVLERASDAARRGAPVLASILGWGESADAHHLTQPHPQGEGASRAIAQALACAGIKPADVDLIAAHATGTPDNDSSEYAAFSRVFGDAMSCTPVVAFKSRLGHTLGGAGAVELILSALSLRDQIIPTCANLTADDVEFPNLKLSLGDKKPAELRATLNTSLGFGGANTCMILGPAPTTTNIEFNAPLKSERDVFITGIGVILPGIVGNEALLNRFASVELPALGQITGTVPDTAMEGLLNARRVRRMSDYVKLTLAATTLACRDAGIIDTADFARDCAAVLGTAHGSSNYSISYYRQIVNEGILAANPMLFAEAVPNGGAAHLSLMMNLRGACQTVIGTRTAGLDAIAMATSRIRSGSWDRAIVSAGEEWSDLVNQAYARCEGESAFATGSGAVTLILESKESIQQRGGKPKATILQTAAGFAKGAQVISAIGDVLEQLDNPVRIICSATKMSTDRAEFAAIRRNENVRVVSAIHGHIAETFSASPLVGIAATVLSRKLPKMLGDDWPTGAYSFANGIDEVSDFAAIASDISGAVSGLRVAII